MLGWEGGRAGAGLSGRGWMPAVPALSRRGAHALASAALQSPARGTARPGAGSASASSGLLTSASHILLAAKELLLLCGWRETLTATPGLRETLIPRKNQTPGESGFAHLHSLKVHSQPVHRDIFLGFLYQICSLPSHVFLFFLFLAYFPLLFCFFQDCIKH